MDELQRAIALSQYDPSGKLAEDVHHVRPVGMGRNRYRIADHGPLMGLSREFHARLHSMGSKAYEGLPQRPDLEEIA